MSQYEFALPDVGEGLDKGVVLAWRVAQGDTVAVDQIVADVETDKAIVEIPAPVAGTVTSLGVQAGETLAVGAVLIVFDTGNTESVPVAQVSAQSAPTGPSPTEPTVVSAPPTGAGVQRLRASPATRKLARSLGVDLNAVEATGSRGQVTKTDVETAAAAPVSTVSSGPDTRSSTGATNAPPPRPAQATAVRSEGEDHTVEPLSGLRRQIALNMEKAWRDVPHIFTLEEIDATELVRARKLINDDPGANGRRLSYLPFFVKACVAALQAHPRFNATLDMANEQIIYHHRYNIGIATATPEGLIVTVVHDADTKSLFEIAEEIETLAGLARERRVTVNQIQGGTFTISNYGSYGAWMGTPIIRPPEVAIAGFGRIHEAVVPIDGQPAVRTMLPMVVSADHRLNDGEHLGEFLATMTRYLSAPIRLLAT
ncbi:MAG: pyruvate dehydrogenase E2 component (dihydrolipoamide acetyltransferase) [Gammaproteobacteria bacterium]|jgi:pyruvate dehydrogenase E2 component (dihydrolipoamide acetyltransferase)